MKRPRDDIAKAAIAARVPSSRVRKRMAQGMTLSEAIAETKARQLHTQSSFSAICRQHGVKQSTAYKRIHRDGWSREDALSTPPQKRFGDTKAID